MTIDNLEQALRLNNAYLKTHISALVSLINTEINTINTNSNTIKTKIKGITDSIDTLQTNIETSMDELSDEFDEKIQELKTDLNSLSSYTDNISDNLTELIENFNNLTDEFIDHKEDTVIHVTQDDKDLWSATLQNAKDYARELFNKIHSFEIIKCESLPTEDINDHAVYFLQIDPKQNDLFEEYMYINEAWELIGNTRIDLSDYVTKSLLQSTVNTLNQLIENKENLLNNAITNLETKHDKDFDDLKEKHNKDLNDLEDKHNQDISDILNTISNINQNNSERNADIDEIIDDINNVINELRHTLSRSITSLTLYIDNNLNNTKSEIEQIIIDLEEKHDQDIQNIINDLNTNYKPFIHDHDNKNVLDKLSADEDKHLLYNGEPVGDNFTEEDLSELISFLWRTEDDYITADNKIFTTKDGYIFMARKGGSV